MRKKKPNYSKKIKRESSLRIPKLRRETNYGSFSYHSPCYLKVKEGEGLPITSPKGYWKTYEETMPDTTAECESEVVITGVDSEDSDPKDLAQAYLIIAVIGLFIGNKLYYACKEFILGRK